MHLRKIIWLLSLLSLAAPARAQVEYLSLDKQTLTLPTRSFYIEQVLDGRTDRAGIGQVRPGVLVSGVARPADLSPNLVAGLTRFVQAQLPARPTDHPALLLVRELRVGELLTAGNPTTSPAGLTTGTGGGITRQARVTLTLYLHAADGYHLVQTASDTVRPSGLLPITPSHERNLAKGIQHCLTEWAAPDWAAAQARPAQPLATLEQMGRVTGGLAYAILTIRPGPGYYATFLDFRNNYLVPTPGLRVKLRPRTTAGWETLPELTPLVEAAGQPSRGLPACWGFSDGQALYMLHQGRYVQLGRRGSSFEFAGLPAGSRPELGAGNLLGAALASHRPVAYTLDLLTGRATQFVDAGRPATRLDTARIYVYRGNVPGPALPVFLNDQPLGELATNQVLSFAWTDPAREPRLRLGAAPAPDLAFLPDFRQAIYVRVLRKAPDPTKAPLELVPARVGEFDLKQLRLRARH